MVGKSLGVKLPLVSAGQFAELCGVHHNTVAVWLKDGLHASRVQSRVHIDLALGFLWVRARDQAAVDTARNRADPHNARGTKLAAEARLRELDVAEREGELVPAADVEARWTQMMSALREAVMAVPGVAVQAGLVEAAREADLEQACRDALTAVARKGAGEEETD